jgi:hypothetical protein
VVEVRGLGPLSRIVYRAVPIADLVSVQEASAFFQARGVRLDLKDGSVWYLWAFGGRARDMAATFASAGIRLVAGIYSLRFLAPARDDFDARP